MHSQLTSNSQLWQDTFRRAMQASPCLDLANTVLREARENRAPAQVGDDVLRAGRSLGTTWDDLARVLNRFATLFPR